MAKSCSYTTRSICSGTYTLATHDARRALGSKHTSLARRSSLGIALMMLAACTVGHQDLETWKGTVKGPGKIKSVLLAPRYDDDLRAAAAVALASIDRPEVHGVDEFRSALKTIQETEDDKIKVLANEIASKISAKLETFDSANSGTAPPAEEVALKDAGYVVSVYADGESKTKIVNSVAGWYAKDFVTRSLSGDFSAEQVVKKLGAPAAQVLIKAIDEKMPPGALVTVARVTREAGDDKAKEVAGTKIVAVVDKMLSPAYIKWAEDKAREQFKSRGKKVKETAIKVIAANYREANLTSGALPAMKQLSEVPVVRDRLFEFATKPAAGVPPQVSATRQRIALFALEGRLKEKHLTPVLNLALSKTADPGVQDAAFDRVLDIGSPKAIPRLWALITGSNEVRDRLLRQVAGATILALGGVSKVSEFISKLPSGKDAKFDRAELAGYAMRLSQMNSKLVTRKMKANLRSGSWHKQALALLYFERKGTPADRKSIKAITSSRQAVVGDDWGRSKIKTTGELATATLKAIEDRGAEPAAAPTSK